MKQKTPIFLSVGCLQVKKKKRSTNKVKLADRYLVNIHCSYNNFCFEMLFSKLHVLKTSAK